MDDGSRGRLNFSESQKLVKDNRVLDEDLIKLEILNWE